jgi:hypothetical protein
MVIVGELGAGWGPGWAATFFSGIDYEQAVERARTSASGHASLVLSAAAGNAFYRGEFRRGRELSREAMQDVRRSAHPSTVLGLNFIFVNPKTLDTKLAAALQILEEVGVDTRTYAWLRGGAAAVAAALGNVDLARREAVFALEAGRRLGSPSLQMTGLYALGLASWHSDPIAARAALEEYIQIARATDFDPVMPRVLALLAQLQSGDGGDTPAALAALSQAFSIAHIDDDRPALAVCLARGAVVMSALGELETAAVFWGAVTQGVFADLAALPANEMSGHHEIMAAVQSELGSDRYGAATANGAAMTYEQINAFALSAVEDPAVQ